MRIAEPTKVGQTAILDTYGTNEIAVARSDAKLTIDGPDITIQTKDGKSLVLPLAAQIATLGKGVFTLKFLDGEVITSDNLFKSVDAVNASPDHSRGIDSGSAQSNETPAVKEVVKEIVKEVVKEVVKEDVVVIDNSANNNTESGTASGEGEGTPVVTASNLSSHRYDEKPEPVLLASAGVAPREAGSPSQPSSPPVQDSPPTTPPANTNVRGILLYQIAGQADDSAHRYLGGTGNINATSDASASAQYTPTLIDLRSESAAWRIEASSAERGMVDGSVSRVVDISTSSHLLNAWLDQSLLNGGFVVILADSPEGQAMNLAPTEFVIRYPAGGTAPSPFLVHVSYVDAETGETITDDISFAVVDNPGSLQDDAGNYLLGSMPNSTTILAGSGNDTIIAGNVNGVYDGGGGTNTVDYSQSKAALVIDFSADVRSEIGAMDQQPDAVNMGKVSSGSVTHYLHDIHVVWGGDYGNTFTGSNASGHLFHGGNGDDTFIGRGGDNLFDGGAGNNTVDYSQVAGYADAYTTVQIGNRTVAINGVDVDLGAGVATHNGGINIDGNAGRDDLVNIGTVLGSGYNDRLAGSAGDDVLSGGNGDNIFIGSAGNDVITGGFGFNAVVYSGLDAAVNVDLSDGRADKGNGQGDTLTGIQGIVGSSYGGILKGAANVNNTLVGTGGNTTFIGNGGSNYMQGGTGNNLFLSGDSDNTIYGGPGHSTVSYEAYVTGGVDIDLATHLGIIGLDYVDRLYDIDVIHGTYGGNSAYRGGAEGIEIHAHGDNNVLMGGIGNNILDGGEGRGNTVDYSRAQSAVNVNLNDEIASQNGYGYQDTLLNIQNIVGSNFSGDVLQGRSGTDSRIDTGAGAGNLVVGTVGNDTFVSRDISNILDYSRMNAGVRFDTSGGIVDKGVNGADTVQGVGFGNWIGSNFDDDITVSSVSSVNAGGGNDIIRLTGLYTASIDGGTGHNTLDTSAVNLGGAYTYYDLGTGYAQGTTSFSYNAATPGNNATSNYLVGDRTNFSNIDVIYTASGGRGNLINWGSASHIELHGSGSHPEYYFINGGGNQVYGGYSGAGESIGATSGSASYASYRFTTSGLNANLDTGVITFTDGRDSDYLMAASRFEGTRQDDVIHGHASQNDWFIASAGNDTYNGIGGTENVYQTVSGTSVRADLQLGTVLKFNSSGALTGTDSVSNIQQFYGTSNDWVHGQDGANNRFLMGSGINTVVSSLGNDYIDGGTTGRTTIDYSGNSHGIVADLRVRTVEKGAGLGSDTYTNVYKIFGTADDDVFRFSTASDLQNIQIAGGGGNDTLQKYGGAGSFSYTDLLMNTSFINKIDFSDNVGDTITVDFDKLLTQTSGSVWLNTDTLDTVSLLNDSGWTSSTSTDSSTGHTIETTTYTNGSHEFVFVHALT